jgi:hypothetical protein
LQAQVEHDGDILTGLAFGHHAQHLQFARAVYERLLNVGRSSLTKRLRVNGVRFPPRWSSMFPMDYTRRQNLQPLPDVRGSGFRRM